MHVDINLLPEKEKRKLPLILIISLLLVVLFAFGAYAWSIYEQKIQEKDNLEKHLAYSKKLREIQQTKSAENNSSHVVDELETAIKWAEESSVSTFLLVRSITSMLPERGFILTFSFTDNGEVQLSVQFDSSRQAAYFLKSLSDSNLINQATLLDIKTETLEETEAKTENVLPRYIAQYSLIIDKKALKKGELEGKVTQ
ncbi:hypothetical protein [Bacillus sp. V5-8f]|uniref:hypothetical protein n=1 Tax=Bacillus sp. V5-8f TaxID=2053044 RepID=UPI000C767FC6|nr:hypothetical protein [Bacillus sp. V5-8f]PLT32394.1 hypothetical protein CUU64_20075 [Bacillus sp. V5-8f]